MKPALLSLPFLLIAPFALAHEALTIPLHFEKKLERESHGFLALFEYGRDAKIMHDGQERAIVPPELTPEVEVAYGFVYFVGQPQGQLDREILFLVEGYQSPEPRFIVDGNNNLDLTDDEPAVLQEGDGGKFLLTLHAADEPEHTFTVRLGFFRDDAKLTAAPDVLAQYQSLLGGYLNRMGGVPTAPEDWFGDQRLNVRSASIHVGEWLFQIGVLDENCNGSYADRGDDLVLVGEFESQYLSRSKSGGATVLGEETLVQIGEQTFEVVEVDPAGTFIRIVPSDKAYTRLKDGAPLPSVDVTLFDGSQADLTAFVEPGKFLLIDFWGHWCAGCLVALPVLKAAAEEWQAELTILSLHHGDHDQAREIIENEGLGWTQAEASDSLIEDFLVNQWPYYVLVDEDGQILKLDIQIHQALELIRTAAGEH